MAAEGLRIDEVTSREAFFALKDHWDELARESAHTVFLTHPWLATWLDMFGAEAEPHVLTAWEGDRLAGALPLARTSERLVRRWCFLGSGALTPNHLGVLACSQVAEQVGTAFGRWLLDETRGWDVLDLDKSDAGAPATSALRAAFRDAGAAVFEAPSAVCPYIQLPARWEEYVASLKRKTRANMGNKRRRLERDHPDARFELVRTRSELDAALDALVAQHQARWRARGYPGAFADPRVTRFHRSVTGRALAAGTLRFYTLTVDGKIAAVEYCYRTGDTVESYLNSMDESRQELSPSTALLPFAIQQSIAEGATCFDKLEGEEAYKAEWCPKRREDLRMLVFRGTRGSLERVRVRAAHGGLAVIRQVVPPSIRRSAVKRMKRAQAR